LLAIKSTIRLAVFEPRCGRGACPDGAENSLKMWVSGTAYYGRDWGF
jgi:hypothetical protein